MIRIIYVFVQMLMKKSPSEEDQDAYEAVRMMAYYMYVYT